MELTELNKYKKKSHFEFSISNSLERVCNAPTDRSGIYIVYAMTGNQSELIYIGSSGQKNKDGSLKVRKSGLGGMKDRIVNGHQFGKVSRKRSWVNQMQIENINTLKVYWWVTYDDEVKDFPTDVERQLINKFKETYNCLPKWNRM